MACSVTETEKGLSTLRPFAVSVTEHAIIDSR